jgi:UDP-N-acetylmuramoyl-tripeptide--D-alanyl-D-alanine ligase
MKSMVENKDTLFTIEEIGGILGASLEGAPGFRRAPITGVKIDSRLIETGDLFVAVKGERRDGHEYVNSALENGAAAVLVSKPVSVSPKFREAGVFRVENTVHALGELAKIYRARTRAEVIAVTGSNGKTTIKNMIYEVLSRQAPSVKSQGNYNNFLGVPLSIFQLRDIHRFGIFELGMSARGEISRLGEICSPDIAVISNVGPVHLEFFKDVKEIASAKLEILGRIKPGGILIINGDDEYLKDANPGNVKLITFGLSDNNDIFPSDLKFDTNRFPRFKTGDMEFRLRFPGIHNVYNALACIAAAKTLGIGAETIAEAIMEYKPGGMRSEIHIRSGITFYIDCYNANPVSMRYALDTLSSMECRGSRIAVLGDMLELGKNSGIYHTEIGKRAKDDGIDRLLAYGEFSRLAAEAFGGGGEHFSDKTDLYIRLKELIDKGDLVLFKASRGMSLEEVSVRIMEQI